MTEPWTHTRDAWEDPTQTIAMHTTSPGFPWATVDLIAVHYTAAATIPADTAGYLRAIQNDYVVNRGYSIGYGVAVTQTGEAWELRGVDWRHAANKGFNNRTFTILCLVDGAEALRPSAVARVREIVAWFRRSSPRDTTTIVPHSQIGATACPGDGIRAQIEAGLLEPRPMGDPDVMFAKVDAADAALLIVDGTSARWLQTQEEVTAAETVCSNDWRDPIILLPIDCKARVFLGRLPFYRDGSVAGAVRCRAEMWAQTI